MWIIKKIVSFIAGIFDFGLNLAGLPYSLGSVLINGLIVALLLWINYHFYGWLQFAISLFLLYAGGAFVSAWNNVKIFKMQQLAAQSEQPIEDASFYHRVSLEDNVDKKKE